MKVLVIAFPSGVQWQLFFDHALPSLPEVAIKHGFVEIEDDYGQKVRFLEPPGIAYLTQDTDGTDRAQVAAMLRNQHNQMTAQSQMQADPRNMLLRPGLVS